MEIFLGFGIAVCSAHIAVNSNGRFVVGVSIVCLILCTSLLTVVAS